MIKLLDFQKQVEAIKKDATNPFFKSNYFDINSLLSAIKPTLNELGLVILQPLTHIDGKPALRTIVLDGDKELVNDLIVLPDLQDPQKMGSAITYYRRYSLQSLLGLQAEDDDANKASGKEAQTPVVAQAKNNWTEQAEKLRKVSIENKKKDIKVFLESNSPFPLKTKEEFENFCLESLGIVLDEKNYDEILKVINNQ
jgi:hypothetical protein